MERDEYMESLQNLKTELPDHPEYRLFTCSYRHQGREWGVYLYATDFNDAKARLSAIHFGTVDGVVDQVIPAYPGVMSYIRFKVWLTNLFRNE